MNKIVKLLLLSLCIGATLTGCKDDPKDAAPYFEIENEYRSLEIAHNDTEKIITVKTNQTFNATPDKSWVKAYPSPDKESANLRLTFEPNTTGAIRSAKVEVKTEKFEPITIDITQSADDDNPPPVDEDGFPRFAVISDIHIGQSNPSGIASQENIVRNIFANLVNKTPKLDAIFVVGDITDWGTASQFSSLKNILNDKNLIPEDIPVYVMMGNHDWYGDNAVNNYLDNTGQPLHQYINIQGYPFITLSMSGTSENSYDQQARDFLTASVNDAASKYPGKPIFVFTHIPVKGTVYGSEHDLKNKSWGTEVYKAPLVSNPQVVLFSGHSHFPLRDPRSIHQGDFTAINDGSSAYSEIDNILSDGIHPPDNYEVHEGLIVNVLQNGDVELERWETLKNERMDPQSWILESPHDGSKFKWTEQQRDKGIAPYFPDQYIPEITNMDEATRSATVSFVQATDDENIFHYKIELILEETGEVYLTTNRFSGFYLGSAMPTKFEYTFSPLTPGTSYQVRVTAYDSFKYASDPIVSEVFTMPGTKPVPADDAPTPDLFNVVFEANGPVDKSERGITVQSVGTKNITYSDLLGTHIANFTGNTSNFYKVDFLNDQQIREAFVKGFTIETYFMVNTLGSTQTPMSAQEDGGNGFEITSGGNLEVWASIGGSSYTTLNSSIPSLTTGKYYHAAYSYDSQTGNLTLYVDGKPDGSKTVSGEYYFSPHESAQWFGIGADANREGEGRSPSQVALNGSVVLARMYSSALTPEEIAASYQNIQAQIYH